MTRGQVSGPIPGLGRKVFTAVIGFLLASGLTTAVLVTIWANGPYRPTKAEFPDFYLPELARDAIGTETDRLQFQAGVLLFPVSLLVFLYFSTRALKKIPDARLDAWWYFIERPALIVCSLFMLTAIAFGLLNTTYSKLLGNWDGTDPLLATTTLAILYGCCWFAFRASAKKVQLAWRLGTLYVIELLILAFFYLLIDDAYVYSATPHVSVHYNAVYHCAVQVYLGKTLLVNTLSQYGQYPELLLPLFSITGLNTAIFSIVMQCLTVASFGCLYLFLRRNLLNPGIAAITLTAMIAGPYFLHCTYQDVGAIYYQYIPIRFIFPCLMILLTDQYIRKPSRWLYWQSFIVNAVAVLWNLDTGLIVFLTWLLCLCYGEIFTRAGKQTVFNVARHIGAAIISLGSIVGLYGVFLRLSSGSWPNFQNIADYQKLYYLHGFYMLPMPLLHPWNAVIFIYASALTWVVWKLFDSKPDYSRVADYQRVAFLSFLGVGIFTYYQGRSHDYVFPLTCYPATLLTGIFVDRILARRVISAKPLLWEILGMIVAAPLAMTVPIMVSAVPEVVQIAESHFPTPEAISIWTEDEAFIREQMLSGQRVLILGGSSSGMYYNAAGTPCGLNLPSFTEMILRKDYQAAHKFMTRDPRARIIARVKQLSFREALLYNALLTTNRIDAIGPGGRLYSFGPAK